MLILILIDVVLFLINPLWGLVGIPVVILFAIASAAASTDGKPSEEDDMDDIEFDWELDDLDKK